MPMVSHADMTIPLGPASSRSISRSTYTLEQNRLDGPKVLHGIDQSSAGTESIQAAGQAKQTETIVST